MPEYPSPYPSNPAPSAPPPSTQAPSPYPAQAAPYPPQTPYAPYPPQGAPYAPQGAPAPNAIVDATTRNYAIGLFACALVILVGVVTKQWFTAGRGQGSIGLTGIEVCRSGMCQSIGWGELNHVGKDIQLFGWLGFLGGLAAVGVTIAIGVLTLQGKAAKIPNRPFAAVLGIAAFSTTMFFMRVIGDQKDISPSWSGFAAVGGLIAVSVLLKKVAPKALSLR
ncbi:MAG: hypothetical protein K8W52_01245 [Deltaproteobacteria bacterium]|nr:hypothetical protein [Deltaproteobacteria bacterium]